MPGKRLWFLFLPILAVQVFLAYFNNEDERPNMRRPMPDQYQPRPAPYARPGTVLKERSRFDPAFTVDVGAKGNSTGTAFSIRNEGVWFTARHVVDGCDRIGLQTGQQGSKSATRAIASACRHRRALDPGRAARNLDCRKRAPGEPARLSRRISGRETRSGREQPDRASQYADGRALQPDRTGRRLGRASAPPRERKPWAA